MRTEDDPSTFFKTLKTLQCALHRRVALEYVHDVVHDAFYFLFIFNLTNVSHAALKYSLLCILTLKQGSY